MTDDIFKIRPLPSTTLSPGQNGDDVDGPSWGLIVPIIMICVFLISVGFCLWWNKCRETRILHLQRENLSFTRSYRRSRSARNSLDAIRDSTRSTLPLRNSINEKIRKNISINNNNIANVSRISKVNVTPVNRPGKYSFHLDVNHWRAYQQQRNPLARSGTKPLSPINEIDSPISIKLSELSRNYDISNQPSCSPYHLAWVTSSNAPSSHADSLHTMLNDVRNRQPNQFKYPGDEYVHGHNMKDPNQNSPFYPNNNTPTTECETESEASQTCKYGQCLADNGSQHTNFPSSPKTHPLLSVSNTYITHGAEEENLPSFGTSYPESSYQTSSRQSTANSSSLFHSGQTSGTEPASNNLSSLPSSIAHFSRQNVLNHDPNNNELQVPNAYMTYPFSKMNYTLASSLESSETHITDNTSMLPNIGSNNTSVYPPINNNFPSLPPSYEHSGHVSGHVSIHVSHEDLSKLVDEMSSIRPVDESSIRPNSTFEPTPHIVSVGGSSLTAGLQESWGPAEDQPSSVATSSQTTSQNESLFWDNYPMHLKLGMSRSYSEIPSQVHDNQGFEPFATSPYPTSLNYHVPVLKETQYWV